MFMTDICSECGAPSKAALAIASLIEPLPPNSSLDVIRLLSTNDPPSDAEIPIVRQIIADDEELMQTLDDQVVHLQSTLAQLMQKRSEIVEHIREHRAILSPLRRVPSELICEIFDLSTAQVRAEPYATPPWRLGCISRSWRQYAVTYPPLWSSLTISALSTYSSRENRKLPAVDIQLVRSAAISLDIYWDSIEQNSPPDSRILDLILPRSNRWRTVALELDCCTSVLDWLEPVRGKLDRLQKLRLVNAQETRITDVFTTAPNLCQIDLRYLPFMNGIPPPHQPSLPISWAQITHYQGNCPWALHIGILEAAPNLSSCVLHIIHDQVVPPPDTIVIMPQLRRLSLDTNSCLLHIVAPNLEELRFVENLYVISDIRPFIRRASCTLRNRSWLCGIVTLALSS
ncbi:hypothetical protein C8R45DRAFT_884413 [Mycena sanguinolenta]|nr:hypothetical protein C8R45DRAFT_884413 [Mycena sanguinolenta]